MAKTIAQLKREIAEQRKRIAKETSLSEKISEKQKLSKQLFELKHQKLIGAGAKAKRLSARFGKRILKTGKKVAPVIQKQAKLIREQQLRDDAIARARLKRKPLETPKVLGRKKRKKLSKKQVTSKTGMNGSDIFSRLDF
tara:strand:+ start:16778 stop:17197 length:420 start_codon:yes stop_codon:yes gene_type:complete